MMLWLGLAVVAATVYAVLRRVEVRLALLVAAVLLGALAGQPQVILYRFFETFTSQQFVVPICSAMGFAYALRHAGCDRELVRLLVAPLRRRRRLLIPGAVLVGYLVNIPIISQTSAAVAIGAVLVPLLLAAEVSPLTTGAALLLGASIGGELFNPGAPEYRTVIAESAKVGHAVTGVQCVQSTAAMNLAALAAATAVFWVLSLRHEARLAAARRRLEEREAEHEAEAAEAGAPSLARALVPLAPLVLLFLLAPPLELIHMPREWLVGPREPALLLREASRALGDPGLAAGVADPFDSRLIGAAMLVGVVLAALAAGRRAAGCLPAFFEGAGYAFTHIISLIVAATCFGEGVKLIGLAEAASRTITALPALLLPAAAVLPLGFAFISGSGFAATQSLFGAFVPPALEQGLPPEFVGSLVSLGAAAGRTMSPVAAVTLMCASMTRTAPGALVRRVAPPLGAGILAALLVAVLLAPGRRNAARDPAPTPPAAAAPAATPAR
jgi:DcuC family C4-dicarboxylate transporter